MNMRCKSYREQNDHIRINGYRGTWYVIDCDIWCGQFVYLLESEQYGDEMPCLIVNQFDDVILDDVYNGLDELNYYWCKI